jgi:hypothetical protein
MRTTILTCIFVAALSATARAQDPQSAPAPTPAVSASGSSSMGAGHLTGPSLWGILPWGGFGIGGRFMIPLELPSVIRSGPIHDTWAVEVGADYLHWNYGYVNGDYQWSEILAVGGMMWMFWVNDQFAFYPKVDLGYAFGWFSGFNYPGRPTYGGLFLSGDAGVVYRLSGGVSLRAELGTDGLKAGAGWLF